MIQSMTGFGRSSAGKGNEKITVSIKCINGKVLDLKIRGLDLTDTLDKYAQTGKEYTEILEQIIKQNNLSDFETVQLTNSVIKKDIQL